MKYALQQESILGVDTHLDVHVAAVINQSGQLLGTQSVSTNTAGYLQLFQWASSFGALKRAGIEGTGTYGSGLCRFLCDKGITVLEVNRPDRSRRRLNGKSDPIDAENAARSVLSGIYKAILYRSSSQVPVKRCVLSRLLDAVPLKRKRRQSIKFERCSLALPRMFVKNSGKQKQPTVLKLVRQ